MTITTDKLLIEINRLQSEVKRLDDKMESAAGASRRKIYRNSKALTTKQLHKLQAELVKHTLKKQQQNHA